jgi:hypothetical protein
MIGTLKIPQASSLRLDGIMWQLASFFKSPCAAQMFDEMPQWLE